MSVVNHTHVSATRQRWAFHPAMGLVAFVTLLYPFLLNRFHATVGVDGGVGLSPMSIAVAAFWLATAFAVPVCCILCAIRLASVPIKTAAQLKALRLSYIGVIGPTAYVFMGVLLYMAGAPLPDEAAWSLAWLVLLVWAVFSAKTDAAAKAAPPAGASNGLRIAHGIVSTVVTIYVAFHLMNHLFGLVSPEYHAKVMAIGRLVYRASFVEPVLVVFMLFQIATGLRLAWRWSGEQVDGFRVFQVASGVYLSIFILGHMNSVFFFARSFLGIDTGWGFATGAPTGLIHDPWNIRLVPHYWLGAFLVLSHLSSGLRIVLTAHGANQLLVFRLWLAGLVVAAGVATVILSAMCGVRLSDFTS